MKLCGEKTSEKKLEKYENKILLILGQIEESLGQNWNNALSSNSISRLAKIGSSQKGQNKIKSSKNYISEYLASLMDRSLFWENLSYLVVSLSILSILEAIF